MPVCNVASDWPRTFLHPRCFCLAFNYHLTSINDHLLNILHTYTCDTYYTLICVIVTLVTHVWAHMKYFKYALVRVQNPAIYEFTTQRAWAMATEVI